MKTRFILLILCGMCVAAWANSTISSDPDFQYDTNKKDVWGDALHPDNTDTTDDIIWKDDYTLWIKNDPDAGQRKKIWVEVFWETGSNPGQTTVLQCYDEDPGSEPKPDAIPLISRTSRDNNYIFTWYWIIDPQPAEEWIVFPDATFRNDIGKMPWDVQRIRVTTKCIIPAPGALILATIGCGLVRCVRHTHS